MKMSKNISWQKLEYIMGIIICIIAFIIYWLTLCPTVNFIDSGELAAVAYTLGIAHPTGYPLFTIIGYIFSHLPLDLRTIYQLNLMSAFFCSLGLFFFFRFLVLLLRELSFPALKNISYINIHVNEQVVLKVFAPAAIGTLFLAFSETFWSQALSIEVYSLHIFFVAVLLYLYMKAIHHNTISQGIKESNNRVKFYFYTFAFVLGLSFTNHMTTILLAPAFIYLYFYLFKINRESLYRLLKLVIPFMIGFSIYLYLPLRASVKPILNWGNPIDIEKFTRHFSGKQYRVWLFTSFESAEKQLNYFFNSLPTEYFYFPIVLAIIGLWSLWKIQKPMFVFTLLLLGGCVLYSINYDIHDIDSYFLLAYFTVAIWAAIGIQAVISLIHNPFKARITVAVLLLSSIILIGFHYQNVNESDNTIVESYTKDMFNSIEPNGIIISYQWDYFVSASYYLQLVEKYRSDVIVIDKELLRRSWYFKQLENQHQDLISNSKKELDAFLFELTKFENDLLYNPNVIEYHYNALIRSIIEKNLETRPVYVTQEIEQQYLTGYYRVPSGLAYRIFKDDTYHDLGRYDFNFQKPRKIDKYIEGIISMYAKAFLDKALYYNVEGYKVEALLFVDKALQVKPDFREAIMFKARLSSYK